MSNFVMNGFAQYLAPLQHLEERNWVYDLQTKSLSLSHTHTDTHTQKAGTDSTLNRSRTHDPSL